MRPVYALMRAKVEIAIVVGLWVVGTIVFRALTEVHIGPVRGQDEFLYWHGAKSFAAGEGVEWRGVDLNLPSQLYVWLISLSFIGGPSVADAYDRVHWINAIVMSGVVIPVFVLARHYVSRWWALAAAVLAVATPNMNFVGMIGTEALAYPLFVAALAAGAIALHHPTRGRWSMTLALAVLAMLTRSQFIVLLAIFPAAIALHAALRPPGERADCLRSMRDPLVVFAVLLVAGVTALAVDARGVLGLYGGLLDHRSPTIGDLWYWTRGYTAQLFLVGGIAPPMALIALTLRGENRRDSGLSALIAISTVAAIALVAQTVWFSATDPTDLRAVNDLAERYMFYVAPLFFVSLVASIGRISTKEVAIAGTVGIACLALLGSSHVVRPFSQDQWGLAAIADLLDKNPGIAPWIGIVLAGLGVASVGALALGTNGWAATRQIGTARYLLAPVLAAVILGVAQGQAWSEAKSNSKRAYAQQIKPLDFIDRATKEPVAVLISSLNGYFVEFWNQRVNSAFAVPGGLPISSPHCKFVVDDMGYLSDSACNRTPNTFFIQDRRVSIDFHGVTRKLRPDPTSQLVTLKLPVRMRTGLIGRNVATGRVDGTINLLTFLDHDARAVVRFAASDDGFTAVASRGQERKIAAGHSATVIVPIKSGSDRVSLELLDSDGNQYQNAVIEDVLLDTGTARPRSIL